MWHVHIHIHGHIQTVCPRRASESAPRVFLQIAEKAAHAWDRLWPHAVILTTRGPTLARLQWGRLLVLVEAEGGKALQTGQHLVLQAQIGSGTVLRETLPHPWRGQKADQVAGGVKGIFPQGHLLREELDRRGRLGTDPRLYSASVPSTLPRVGAPIRIHIRETSFGHVILSDPPSDALPTLGCVLFREMRELSKKGYPSTSN
ncbi:hypothetical protein AAFF_G00377350 [Aldrovandia affinis]|uniref:Uncharacterized protein n=1 Tax=Aldrovandia affinis TaxID=143900 RepID=A0AAD7SFX2_9TELE|nr:hypothetical protein AAFF_G00377350 [Aldrovandia affinis]